MINQADSSLSEKLQSTYMIDQLHQSEWWDGLLLTSADNANNLRRHFETSHGFLDNIILSIEQNPQLANFDVFA